jgi:hypothetical protein
MGFPRRLARTPAARFVMPVAQRSTDHYFQGNYLERCHHRNAACRRCHSKVKKDSAHRQDQVALSDGQRLRSGVCNNQDKVFRIVREELVDDL